MSYRGRKSPCERKGKKTSLSLLSEQDQRWFPILAVGSCGRLSARWHRRSPRFLFSLQCEGSRNPQASSRRRTTSAKKESLNSVPSVDKKQRRRTIQERGARTEGQEDSSIRRRNPAGENSSQLRNSSVRASGEHTIWPALEEKMAQICGDRRKRRK